MRQRWHKKRRVEVVELNITAFMNLMVILVPFLLMTAVFSQVAILELTLPSSGQQIEDMPDVIQLEVIVREDSIEVGERNTGLLTALQRTESGHDLSGLSEYLKRVKAKYPDKIDATLLLESDISYDVLVQVMDTVRVFEAQDEGRIFHAELFPEISIGDAPVRSKGS